VTSLPFFATFGLTTRFVARGAFFLVFSSFKGLSDLEISSTAAFTTSSTFSSLLLFTFRALSSFTAAGLDIESLTMSFRMTVE